MTSAEEFLAKVKGMNTNMMMFIKLFNLWNEMSIDERGRAIDISLGNGSLQVKKEDK